MKIKVCEAEGPVLDWLVAKASGVKVEVWDFDDLGMGCVTEKSDPFMNSSRCYAPTRYWQQGGPIIDREKIDLIWERAVCQAELEHLMTNDADYAYGLGYGPTPLIAAMRCYVASKLGDEVEIPEELV